MLSTMPSRRALRGVVLAAAMAVLAACQTVPPLPAFSESQIAAMQDAGKVLPRLKFHLNKLPALHWLLLNRF